MATKTWLDSGITKNTLIVREETRIHVDASCSTFSVPPGNVPVHAKRPVMARVPASNKIPRCSISQSGSRSMRSVLTRPAGNAETVALGGGDGVGLSPMPFWPQP
jgi:hypothetical protein